MRINSCLRILTLSLFLYARATAQYSSDPNPADYTKPIDIIPPSPNAAALGRYGGINTSSSSGMMSYDIPVYEYVSSNIKLPISLSYNSGGLRVDEIGSRVGMSWVLNAGGVISRTVYGRDDVQANRLSPPSNFPARTRGLIDFMEALSLSDLDGNDDAEPDVFTFNINGASGKFILDASRNPVLLTHSSIKIESNFSNPDWNFKVTTGDGVEYYFGGTAVESSSKQQSGTGCGKIYHSQPITSWYLIKIVHPNNDVVTFTYSSFGIMYSSGIAQSMFNRNTGQQPAGCAGKAGQAAPVLNNTTCVIQLMSQVLLLQEINSTGGGRLKFNYIDRIDINNDKLLSSIEVFKPGNANAYKIFSFEYENAVASNSYSSATADNSCKYRPFLTGYIEKSPDNLLTKKYSFSYNDINGLPRRLSYSQDAYGFFNGKPNSTLIPKPQSATWQQALPGATANRDPDPYFGIKGMLSKIIYPTGGQDTIIYEGNTVYSNEPFYADPVNVQADTYGSGRFSPVTVVSNSFLVGLTQEVRIMGNCIFDPSKGYDRDEIHQFATVKLLDVTNGTGNAIFNQKVQLDTYFDELVYLQEGHTYQVSVTANGAAVRGSGGLTYIPNLTYQYVNKVVGGVRVAKVITSTNTTNAPTVKKYLYYNPEQPEKSSGQYIYQPVFEKYLKVYVPCESLPDFDPQNPAGIVNCGVIHYEYYSLYSNTQNNLYTFSAAPITYRSVVESFGENFENGGIQHLYKVSPDLAGIQIIGEFMPGAPLSDYSWNNGREIYQYAFKKQGDNYIPVKKIYTHYNEDARAEQEFKSYICNKKYSAYCQSDPPSDEELNAFDLQEYSLFKKWIYADSVRTLTYDINGLNYVEELVVTSYNNKDHAMPTTIATKSSDGRNVTINNAYPYDITLSGVAETARQAMISKHMISPVLQVQKMRANNPVFTARTDYTVFPNGLVLPQSQYVQTANNAMEKRLEFTAYDNSGKLLEQSKTDDAKSSYIWDYKSMYAIASVVNAKQSDIAYTSFEADGTGNWNIGSSTRSSGAATGNMSYQLSNGAISKHGLNASISYVVSYWSTNGSYAVTGAAGNPFTGKTISVNGQNWTYYQHKVTGVASVTITGSSGAIDELRLYPVDAQMTTYIYEPFVGVTSQCDPGNHISWYEYDALGRLKLIRDEDNNILKTYDYKYQVQQ